MAEVAKKRGRPKGSKNRRRFISGQTVEDIAIDRGWHPTHFLYDVAMGIDNTAHWTKDDRLKAAQDLHKSIHNGKKLLGDLEGELGDGQLQLTFIESTEYFELPGETSTGSTTEALRPVEIQRAGLPSPDGENGVLYEQDNQARPDEPPAQA